MLHHLTDFESDSEDTSNTGPGIHAYACSFYTMLSASHVQPPAVTSAGKLSESAEPSPLKKDEN